MTLTRGTPLELGPSVCEGPPGTDICVLDCTSGACPDGMMCIDVFGDGMFMRCIW